MVMSVFMAALVSVEGCDLQPLTIWSNIHTEFRVGITLGLSRKGCVLEVLTE